MSTVALRRGVLECLALAGGWVPRADLDALTTCAVALDDVLADLVVKNTVVFKLGIGYRLAGDPLVRGAMRSMARGGQNRAVMGMQQKVPEGAQLRLGVAQRMPDGGVVGYLLELPPVGDAAGQLAQAQQLTTFLAKNLCEGMVSHG